MWTEEKVEDWLREAAQTLRLQPDRELRYLVELKANHPEIYYSPLDIFAAEVERRKSGMPEEIPTVKLVAGKPAIKRLGIVTGWFGLLEDADGVRVLWARVNGLSWYKVGKQVGRSKTWAEHRFGLVLCRLTTILNKI